MNINEEVVEWSLMPSTWQSECAGQGKIYVGWCAGIPLFLYRRATAATLPTLTYSHLPGWPSSGPVMPWRRTFEHGTTRNNGRTKSGA